MRYRRLGNTGLFVSTLSYGSWITFKNQVDITQAKTLLKTAYDHGVNFFDNAEVYAKGQSEVIMGRAIKALKWTRDSFCVSSKAFWGGDLPTQKGLSRKHLVDACHGALKRLQVDYLDLYYCHRPDPHTPVSETVEAMSDLVRQGKVLYWGTSEWPADKIAEAHRIAQERYLVAPSMEQPQYNLFCRKRVEEEYSPIYPLGLGLTTYSPMASGLLTGKYSQGIPKGSRATLSNFAWIKENIQSEIGQRKVKAVDHLKILAQDLGVTVGQLAIGWCLKNPRVSTVILGAKNKTQLLENLKALDAADKIDTHHYQQMLETTQGLAS